jgi:DNA-binding HxlR family transcriptional regulator
VLGRDYQGQNCSIARALEILGERWTLLIVRDAFLGVRRFDAFGRKLGVAPNILSRRLETLTDGGVLEKRAYQHNPTRYEYLLTERGLALFPVMVALLAWGDDGLSPAPPVLLRHACCGGDVDARTTCTTCGAAVTARDVEWWWGPGSGREPSRIPVPAIGPAEPFVTVEPESTL